MKTIIVATNYSNESVNAVNFAAAFAKHTNSKLFLFNSFELSVHAANTVLPASAIEELLTENKEHLKEIAINTAREYNITVESLCRYSFLKDELDYQVERLKADLVVMGMTAMYSGHGHKNSTTSIMCHAKYPVLAVPEHASFNGISKILFAVDPDFTYYASQLPLLKKIASYFNAEVQVCHVEKNDGSVLTGQYSAGNGAFDVDELLNGIYHSYGDIAEDDVIKGIEIGIQNFSADMLVMVPQKYNLWDSIWHHSKTSEMACKTHIPLLSIPAYHNAS